MEGEKNNNQNSEANKADNESPLLNTNMSSEAHRERLDSESQSLEDCESSDRCIVQPSDVMTIQEVQDDPADMNLSIEEMQLLEDVLYEFPKDPEDAVSNSTDIFNRQDISTEDYLNIQINKLDEYQGIESGKISEIKICEILQQSEPTVNEAVIDRQAVCQNENKNDQSGSNCKKYTHIDEPVSYNKHDIEIYTDQETSDQQGPHFPIYVSDDFADVEDNCEEPTPKRKESDKASGNIITNCAYTDLFAGFEGNNSGINEMAETGDKTMEIATGGLASKEDSFASRSEKSSEKSYIFSKYCDAEASQNQGNKLFGNRNANEIPKETHLVNGSKMNYGASCSYEGQIESKPQMNARMNNEKNRNILNSPMPAILAIPEQKPQFKDHNYAGSDPAPSKIKKKVSQKNRCNHCNVRLGLCAIRCRCGNFYCAKHRYDKDHGCTFDYKAMGAEEIRKNNPQVIAEKVRKL